MRLSYESECTDKTNGRTCMELYFLVHVRRHVTWMLQLSSQTKSLCSHGCLAFTRGPFFAAVRSQEPLEEAVTYCLQKQAHVQKVASSSPKSSWENAVSMRHERAFTHPFADDTERHFSNFYVELLPQVRVLGINVLFLSG